LSEKLFLEFEASSNYIKDSISKLVGGNRVIDLLLHPPFEYRSLSIISPENSQKPEGVEVILEITILSHEPSFKISPKNPYKIFAEMEDGTSLIITFFAGNAGMWKGIFKEGSKYKIACKLQKFGSNYHTTHPKILPKTEVKKLETNRDALSPRYPLTGNLTQIIIKNTIEKHLRFVKNFGEDWTKEFLPSLEEAILQLHNPSSIEDAEKARKRLAFDELLAKNLAFLIANSRVEKEVSPKIEFNQNFLSNALKVLPFDLTDDQSSALTQILKLQGENKQNNALLQGDVGSGKTVVAILASINAVLAGFQVAVMSPTFILAKQTFEAFLQIAEQFNISVLFISGEDKGRKRREKARLIEEGEAQIVVGTHALFSEDIKFARLGYAIIDEQHRFGINQRLALSTKSSGVKTLLMTATPIPRTLQMALIGDIEMIYIKNKPKNRKDIITKLFSEEKLEEIISASERKIASGEQVYWVVPFIEEAEEGGARRNGTSIEMRKKVLHERFGEKLAIVHGKMKEGEIDAEMLKFKTGERKIMLATTVIEVGVNVPNATLIVIESAEGFGLSTLHQLRGRVGRGDLQSYCFLIASSKSETVITRLKTITNSNDGFFIAEKDMEMRGSGAIFSKMQSGFEGFKFVKPSEDAEIFKSAKIKAREIFKNDPNLEGNIVNLMKFYNYDIFINYFKI
jgi:ATP-dependent DNA helicase RecG